jgi:nucleotide-binding universal stress UspA family protein
MNFSNILVPTDFSETARHACDLSVEVARAFDAKITLVHAYELPAYAYSGLGVTEVDFFTPIEDAARKQLEDEEKRVLLLWPNLVARFRRGPPWQQILRCSEEESADLIVMGTHGRTGLSHALLGSVAEKVVRLAKVPVMTVRGPNAN